MHNLPLLLLALPRQEMPMHLEIESVMSGQRWDNLGIWEKHVVKGDLFGEMSLTAPSPEPGRGI
jgi:hypothetical protein